ncbi:Os01g0499400 [Oryza sativa Japonica Group]|uniref:Os01g0499400 protein n=1 Tax=Oryza sativa subsp. japonica TaxID=39947 RepID=A0A0P0V2W7_ORYSJ|nr:Os01g0499400 [Oryza sativa Japonica Group]
MTAAMSRSAIDGTKLVGLPGAAAQGRLIHQPLTAADNVRFRVSTQVDPNKTATSGEGSGASAQMTSEATVGATAAAIDQLGEGGDAADGAPGSSSLDAGAKSSSSLGAATDQSGEDGDTTDAALGSSSPGTGAKSSAMSGAAADKLG